MKYMIIGTGGTGCSIGGFLASAGKDVTFLSRGKNLLAFKENGLNLKSTIKGDMNIKEATFVSVDELTEKADVIFVCVKGYSVESIIDIIEQAAHSETIIIPIMNGYNMGETISSKIKQGIALEGCIYISAFIESPGTIVQLGKLFRVVFGPKKGQEVDTSILEHVRADLADAGIDTTLSYAIERDTFKKFSFISSYAACGAYHDCTAYEMTENKEINETFISLGNEIKAVGEGLGIEFDVDIVEANINILNSLTPDTTASMQKDMKAGKKSEVEGLVFTVTKLGKQLGLDMSTYEKVSKHFGYEK